MIEIDGFYEITVDEITYIARYIAFSIFHNEHIFDVKYPKRSALYVKASDLVDKVVQIKYLHDVTMIMV